MQDETITPRTARLQSLSDGLAGLSGLFWKGPEQLWSDILEDLTVLGQDLPGLLDSPTAAACLALAGELRTRTERDLKDDLEPLAVRLFVNSLGGMSAPPYESCWGDGAPRLSGPAAESMLARLEAAELDLDSGASEPADHLCIELDYLCHLLETAAESPHPELLRQAGEFAEEVMRPWVTRFAARVGESAPDSVFALAAAVLVETLSAVRTLLADPA